MKYKSVPQIQTSLIPNDLEGSSRIFGKRSRSPHQPKAKDTLNEEMNYLISILSKELHLENY